MKQKLILAFKTLISVPVGIIGLCLALAAAVLIFRGSVLSDFVRDAITGNTSAESLTELIAEAEEEATEREVGDDGRSVAVIPENANVYNSLLQEWRDLSLNSKGQFEALIDYHSHTQEFMQHLVERSASAASQCGRGGITVQDLQRHDLHKHLHRLLWCRNVLVGEWFIAAHENYQSGTLAMRVPWLTFTIALHEDGTYEWSEDLRRLWGWPESKDMNYSTEWTFHRSVQSACPYGIDWQLSKHRNEGIDYISLRIDDERYAHLIMSVLGPNEIEVRMIELTRHATPSPLPSSRWYNECSRRRGYRTSEFTLVRKQEID